MQLLRNPHVRDSPADATSPTPALGFPTPADLHRSIPGYAPTALLPVPALAARLGLGQVLVKHELERFGLPAFKILGGSWAVYRVLAQRYEAEHGTPLPASTFEELLAAFAPYRGTTLVTATDGNHGRGIARCARWFGLGADIYMPEGTADARVAAIESEGATVTVVDGDYDDAVATAAATAADDRWVVSDTSWPGYTDVPTWIADGYTTMLAEVEDQVAALGARVDGVVVPVGVGALAKAVLDHWTQGPPAGPVRVSVEPVGADCLLQSLVAGEPVTTPGPHRSMMAGMNCGTVSDIAWPVMSERFDWAVAIEDDPAAEAMRLLADEGIVVGETGAGAVGALLAVAAEGDGLAALGLGSHSTVVCLCTEGATDPVNYERVVGRSPAEVAAAH